MGVTDRPSSVFAKQFEQSSRRFEVEISALQFLKSIRSGMGPEIYGFDPVSKLLVLEDLGPKPESDTSSVLLGRDPDLAVTLLIDQIRTIAELHGATHGKWEAYRTTRLGISSEWPKPKAFSDPWPDNNGESIDAEECFQTALDYVDVVNQIGVFAHNSVVDEIVALADRTEGAVGSNWCFCKGDQNGAGDTMRANGELRLMDFDASGFRPLWSEGMPERFTWGCLMRFPDHVSNKISATYREVLSQYSPTLANDRNAQCDAAARWHVFHVLNRLPEALILDRDRGPSKLRQQVIAWLRAFERTPLISTHFPALSSCGSEILNSLRSEWDDDSFELPLWPAFRSG